jgi:hypothetical protein
MSKVCEPFWNWASLVCYDAPVKMSSCINTIQMMASSALTVIRCIYYLAYRSIFTHSMFHPKNIKLMFFFAKKAVDERWEVHGASHNSNTQQEDDAMPGDVRHGLYYCRTWPSGISSGAMHQFTTSRAMPGMLGLIYFALGCVLCHFFISEF